MSPTRHRSVVSTQTTDFLYEPTPLSYYEAKYQTSSAVPPRTTALPLSPTLSSADISDARGLLRAYTQMTDQLELFVQASEASGDAVVLPPRFGFLPMLVGRDQKPVPLCNFVEVLDEAADYDEILAAFPSLSFGQISGALAFLRKLVQFNTKGVDIDHIEDEAFEASDAFRAALEQAVGDQEISRVLFADEPHR